MWKSIKTKWVYNGCLLMATFVILMVTNMFKNNVHCSDLASEKGDE